MSAMIDTNVLVYLISEEPDPATDPDEHAKWLASRELVALVGQVVVSAIVWFEIHNVTQDPGVDPVADRLVRVQRNLFVEPLDLDVAETAPSLLNHDYCQTCYSHAEDKTCGECGHLIGKALRLNDAMIVAHAELLPDVDTLYTYDGGMIKMAERGGVAVKVVQPPVSTGLAIESFRNMLRVKDSPDAPAEPGDSMSIPVPTLDDDADPDEDAPTDPA